MGEQKLLSVELSRRCLLQRVACAAGTAAVLGASNNMANAGKMTQGSVGYKGSPNGSEDCSNCRLFQAPSSCKSVEGTVSASGWCRIWVKK